MTLKKSAFAVASLLLASTSLADLSNLPSGTYKVDPRHGYLLFSYSHFGLSEPQVGFNAFEAAIDLDADDPTQSGVEVTVDVASVDSRVDVFDDHLRGEDWFDAEAHPEITFSATSITVSEGGYAISGDVTIKGITKPVTLSASIASLENHPIQRVPAIGVSATGTVNRSDFDLGAYAPAVSDEISLTIEAEFLLD
ncbi:MAG: YceI family protein [Pseudomonadota bacterium]